MFHDIFTGSFYETIISVVVWTLYLRWCCAVVVRELIRGQLLYLKPRTLKIRKSLFLNVLVTNYSRKYLFSTIIFS